MPGSTPPFCKPCVQVLYRDIKRGGKRFGGQQRKEKEKKACRSSSTKLEYGWWMLRTYLILHVSWL